MSFIRQANAFLEYWKKDKRRKPLIIRGARQVGKTTLVREFSKSYKHSILLNLEKKSDLSHFQSHDEVKTIVETLFLSHDISIRSIKETLLFIDEIQESPKAIHLLRYFYEEIPELNVIAAGSLLEFAMQKVKSFPVGRVDFLYLYPLNFIEYLQAIKHKSALEQLNEIPVKPFAHSVLLDLFNQFVIIGGMPEVVNVFIETDSLTDLPRVYESIWQTYLQDVEKYTTNDTERKVIKHILSVAHLYIDQRIKFQNFGNSNYRSREVGEAMRNLDAAKIIQLIYPTTNVEVPVMSDIKKSPRLQFLDTGLVNHALDIQAEMLGINDLSNSYKGAVIPHMVTQELISLNQLKSMKPNFWVREKKQASSEVDLVFKYKDKLVPIEIKSGSTGSLKSLHQFIERTNHSFAVRIYAGEFKIEQAKTPAGKEYKLMNLPYYLSVKIPEYIACFIEPSLTDFNRNISSTHK